MRRALDLFCSAGGVTKGLQMAGFHVTGIDIKPQPRYCGDAFIQADATNPPVDLNSFDYIWASPPCQAHTAMKTLHNAKDHSSFIDVTRALLVASGKPYTIENVVGSPLESPVLLCGTAFGLGTEDADLQRHRMFESNFPILAPQCRHRRRVIGVYGGHARNRRRDPGGSNKERGMKDFSAQDAHRAMGIDWMTLAELSQAIPPAYSHFIAGHVRS